MSVAVVGFALAAMLIAFDVDRLVAAVTGDLLFEVPPDAIVTSRGRVEVDLFANHVGWGFGSSGKLCCQGPGVINQGNGLDDWVEVIVGPASFKAINNGLSCLG